MSSNSRRFLIGAGAAIVLAFVIAGVAIVAYNAGRNSSVALDETRQSVTVSVKDGAITITSDETADEAQTPIGTDVDTSENEAAADPTSTPDAATQEQQEETESSSPTPDAEPVEATPSPEPTIEQEQTEGPREPVELDSDDVELLLEVWEIIDEEFDGALPAEVDVTYNAIVGSLELLDDNYTRFITPQIADHMREQLNGSFEGIGAFVDLDPDGYLVIVRPIEDQPAERAGILADDLISHVNGDSVLGMTLEEITTEIKGPEGTQVTLTVIRLSLDEPFDVTVTRERIEIPIVSGEMLEDDIAYVRLSGFSSNASEQLELKITELMDQEPRALILDLRDNPGGFLSQSVAVADLFLGEGIVLFERDSRDLEEVFESQDGELAEEIELVVLVNAGSASASEIVAGAIQDRSRGLLVGETTFGKGSVQQTHTLRDGSELRVTIACWYTPDNRSISVNGIAPDILVESPEEFGTDADTQLQKAIQLILEGS
jgi:carboxyl-terminal processing protease